MSVSTSTPSADRPRESASSSPQQAPPPAAPRWPVYVSVLVIIAAIFAAYANSFSGAMVLDDRAWILENPSIQPPTDLGKILAPDNAKLLGGRPIVSLTLALNYAIGEKEPAGYHAVNLLIHLLAALLLFGIVRRTLLLPVLRERFGSMATPLALAVALIWGVHPLTTAAVTYIIQRTESLAAMFYLATLYCFIRGGTSAASGGRIAWNAAAVAACLFGMLTKETVFTAPLVVLLYDRTFLAGSFGESLRTRAGLYAALAATWLACGLGLWLTNFHGGTVGPAVHAFTWQTYLETQPGVILHYLQTAFWPTGLSLDYNWPPPETVSQIAIPGTIIVVLLGLVVVGLIERSALGFLGAAFFLILAPTSSFIPIRDAAFDHRMYLPLAALVTLVVIGVWSAWNWVRGKVADATPADSRLHWAIPAAIVAVVVVALGLATAARNELYASEQSIWKDAIEKNPRSWRGHASLGYAAAEAKDYKKAIGHFEDALKRNDDEPKVHLHLADALTDEGNFENALHHYKRALELAPKSGATNAELAVVQTSLALALSRQASNDPARITAAIGHYREAIKLDPQSSMAYRDLAGLLLSQGKFEEAAQNAQAALAIKPDDAVAHANLGLSLFALHRWERAVEHLKSAMQINPQFVSLEFTLVKALNELRRFDEAIDYLERALRRSPNDALAHIGLGNLYEKRGQPEKAIPEYEKALALDPDRAATVHLNLGAIYAAQDKLDDAISHYSAILKEDDAPSQVRVAELYRRNGDMRKAMIHYRTALSIDPKNVDARKRLADFFKDQGQTDEAIDQFRELAALTPNDASAHNSLAVLLMRQGTSEAVKDALDHFQKAADLEPDNPNSHYNLGMIYYRLGDGANAAKQWRIAAEKAPARPDYLRPLAWLLATSPDANVRNGSEAVELSEKAAKLTDNKNPEIIGTLAAAYAEAGQFPKAVTTAEKALDMAVAQSKTELVNELSARIKEYRDGKPYRQSAPGAAAPRQP